MLNEIIINQSNAAASAGLGQQTRIDGTFSSESLDGETHISHRGLAPESALFTDLRRLYRSQKEICRASTDSVPLVVLPSSARNYSDRREVLIGCARNAVVYPHSNKRLCHKWADLRELNIVLISRG